MMPFSRSCRRIGKAQGIAVLPRQVEDEAADVGFPAACAHIRQKGVVDEDLDAHGVQQAGDLPRVGGQKGLILQQALRKAPDLGRFKTLKNHARFKTRDRAGLIEQTAWPDAQGKPFAARGRNIGEGDGPAGKVVHAPPAGMRNDGILFKFAPGRQMQHLFPAGIEALDAPGSGKRRLKGRHHAAGNRLGHGISKRLW